MLSTPRILSILAINLLLTQQEIEAWPWPKVETTTSQRHYETTTTFESKLCNDCTTLLSELTASLQNTTEITERIVEEIIQEICGREVHFRLLQEVCENFEEKIIHELFMFIKEMEKKIDVERGCKRIRLCPHVKH
ncbi:hypothetical protein KIN20_014321 [Parelaphostrongylus tenuis]|uniref:Saposin B-type domain-containing protein n=1 Tax=Parelaphostrongylus tenuis TaxID=148309 RepID=A0AAD5QP82_PARTN|nr:hypothetical protein KIN20_014321 [Parelaphostrongylus tenuis]